MASDWVDFFRRMKKPVAAVVVFLSFIEKHELEWEIPYSIARVSFNSSLLASFYNLSFTSKKYGLSRCIQGTTIRDATFRFFLADFLVLELWNALLAVVDLLSISQNRFS